MASHWLVKQEPTKYPFSQLLKDKKTTWDGVRNFQARNNLRAMKKGDAVLYYHSVEEKSVVGLAEVIREAYPDPTSEEGDWSVVDLKPIRALPRPVTLAEIKAHAKLKNIALLKQSRLSVMPITPAEYETILQLGTHP
ncbi:MAG: EVE domain-containing protein [Candidatus Methylacidiphilales bacterium]|nr:EVE domain-containing protein [Candidatus Methylacidiphilales bacterium]